jgi:hypothetical protein
MAFAKKKKNLKIWRLRTNFLAKIMSALGFLFSPTRKDWPKGKKKKLQLE